MAPVPTLTRGAIAGGVTSLTLALLALFIVAVDVSWIFVNANQGLADILQFDQGPGLGSVLQILAGTICGLVGATLHLVPSPVARALSIGGIITIIVALMEPFIGPVLRNLSLDVVEEFLYSGGGLTLIGFIVVYALVAGGVYAWARRGGAVKARYQAMPSDRRRTTKLVAYVALVIVLLILPQVVGQRLSEVIGTVGIYVLLGLGLNIVVGFAGLLDLGYVAFYAVGAYVTAILTSPASPAFSPDLGSGRPCPSSSSPP